MATNLVRVVVSCLLPFSFFLLPAFLLTSRGHAQEQPVFRASSELVVLHVSVRDRGGRYITGLTRDAFTVIDDATPQQIEMFSSDEVPASVGFLIDNSNSMRPSRERVVAAAVAFAQHSHPQDEIFVLTFNEQVQEAWRPTIVSEMNTGRFASAMSASITARGMTAIYDGIMSGLSRLERARHTRQVLIAVSDGGDNASKAKLDDTLKRVHDSDATIYAVALIDPLMKHEGNPRLLRRLARATGGEVYEPRRVDDVPEAFERISKGHSQRLHYCLHADEEQRRYRAAPSCREGVRPFARRPRPHGANARRLLREDARGSAVKAIGTWLVHLFEWLLLGFGLGCLGMYAYETVEARRFQTEQTAAFERGVKEELTPRVVRGGLVGMLDVPRLQLSTPVIEGDDTRTLQRAVGHLPDTPMPWDAGTARSPAIVMDYSAPEGREGRRRDSLPNHARCVSLSRHQTSIVMPDDLSVLAPQSDPATLTLITCYPFYYVGSAPKRFVVHAVREQASSSR
jgi:Ca-activated chloride channel family protein